MTGPVKLEVGELESSVRELEEKIALMETAGDQLAESMESAAVSNILDVILQLYCILILIQDKAGPC